MIQLEGGDYGRFYEAGGVPLIGFPQTAQTQYENYLSGVPQRTGSTLGSFVNQSFPNNFSNQDLFSSFQTPSADLFGGQVGSGLRGRRKRPNAMADFI